MALTLRLTKGSPLTHTELDDNFSHLQGLINSLNTETGSLLYSGSFNESSSTLVLYSDNQIYEIDLSALVDVTDTGSFYISSSVNLNTITFTQGDGTTESVTVDTGSDANTNIYSTDGTLAGARSVGAGGNNLTFEFANAHFIIDSDGTQEVQINNLPTEDTPQVVGYVGGVLKAMNTSSIAGTSTDISALNTFTGSIQTEVDSLTAATSSYLTVSDTGSFYYSSSVELNTVTFYQGDGTTESVTVDTGSVGTLQTVTDNGNTTTNDVEISGSLDVTGSLSMIGQSTFTSLNNLSSPVVIEPGVGSPYGSLYMKTYATAGTIAEFNQSVISINSSYTLGSLKFSKQTSTWGLIKAQATNTDQKSVISLTANGTSTPHIEIDGENDEITINNTVLAPDLANTTTPHIVGYDIASGELTYYGTGSFGGGDSTDISALNTFTGSIQTEVDSLTAATSSFVTNSETSSFLYSGSYNSSTNEILLYSVDTNYSLDLSGLSGGGGGGLAITASDEGVVKTENARSFDFVGNGVVATNSGNAVTVNITQVDTGSLYYSSSVELNTITFTQGDGTTESVTVDTGSSVDISALNFHTGSINTFTGSIQTEVDNLTSATSSYVTNDDTGSFYYSSSVELNTVTFYQGDGTTESVTVDTGSGTNLGTADQNLTGARTVTANGSSLTFEFDSAPFIINSDAAQRVTIANLPTEDQPQVVGIDSSGNLKAMNTSSIAGTSTDISALNLFTGSIQTEVDSLTAATSSYLIASDTGSFYFSSSVANNTITFNQGDGTTESVTVSNLYTADGNLTGTRTVTANGNNLILDFATSTFVIDSDPGHEVQINNLPTEDTSQVVGYVGGVLKAMPTSSFKPKGPLNTFQFNKNNAFSGSSLFFDSGNERVGIGESSPLYPLHITDTRPIGIRLERTDDPIVGIQFFGSGSSGGGSVIRGLANDFEIIQRDTVTGQNERNLFISESGEVYIPRIDQSTTVSLLGYDTATGEVTYQRSTSNGGGRLNNFAVPTGSLHYGTNTVATAATSSFVTIAGTVNTGNGLNSHNSREYSALVGKTLGTDAFVTATWKDYAEGSISSQYIVVQSITAGGALTIRTGDVVTGTNDAIMFTAMILI